MTITVSAEDWTCGNCNIDILDNDFSDDCSDCSCNSPVVKEVIFKTGMICECEGKTSLTIDPGVKIEKEATVIFKAPKVTAQSGANAEARSTVYMKQH